jgi:phosphatidylserine synthase 2
MYFCFVIVMLNHRPEYGRYLMGYLDERLNAQRHMGTYIYDDTCDLNWANFYSKLDHYYAVHLGDWFLSSFVLRDYYLLHIWSIMDEIIELSWQHILPHFGECWWDHIIIDIMLSNTPAIMFGMFVINRLGLVKYDFWHRFDDEGNTKPIAQWGIWHCHRKFGIMCYISGFMKVHFLNGFFINSNLNIPPVHPFPVIRLLLWFALGALAFREGYDDSRTWNTVERYYKQVSGRYRWLGIAILSTEALMCYKYRKDTGNIQHDAATPLIVSIPWAITIIFMVGYYLSLRLKKDRTTKYPVEEVRRMK